MGLGIPPLKIKIMLESNPPNSTMLVGRLGVHTVRPVNIILSELGGTTCVMLLVNYGLICFLRHYLSNTAKLN